MAEAPTAMVDRVVLIMRCFRSESATLALADIVQGSGVPRSSVHRIVSQLVAVRWLDKVESGYRLGLGVFELGAAVPERNRLVAAVRQSIRDARPRGVSVHVLALDATDVICLDRVVPAARDPLGLRVGARVPAVASVAGRALLAHAEVPSDPRSEALDEDLARVRMDGIAVGLGVGGRALIAAAPVFDVGGVRCAVSVSAFVGEGDAASLGPAARRIATAATRALGGVVMQPAVA